MLCAEPGRPGAMQCFPLSDAVAIALLQMFSPSTREVEKSLLPLSAKPVRSHFATALLGISRLSSPHGGCPSRRSREAHETKVIKLPAFGTKLV